MLNKDYHRLLKRQLTKAGFNTIDNPEMVSFIQTVNAAYNSFDKDIYHLENVLELSSTELFALNEELTKERDNTKSKLEHVVDHIGGIIFETDLEGNFTYLNTAWEKYIGYSLKETLGRNYKKFIPKKNVEENKKHYNFFNKKNTVFIFKLLRDNKTMWFELRAKLFKNAEKKASGFIGTITDITNLKETEIELHKASISKDEFLSTMSHEIRTPLNAVTGLSNILLMEDYLPEQVDTLKALKYSSEHLLGLINDLLDFNKIKSGKVDVVEKEFSLISFLDHIVDQFSLQAIKKGIRFELIKENEIPENIIGDKLVLTQIIQNLLSNSFKFTKKGSITLSVKNQGVIDDKITLGFKVIDTGIGITKSRQETIFESFVQASSEIAVKYGGTGLGLSICRRLLRFKNSDLQLSSKLGKGSTFFFNIAFKINGKSYSLVNNKVNLKPVFKSLNINVLVAEDNKMNVLILKKFFLNWNVNFTVVENGEEAFKLFKKDQFDFDLVLMDLQMPILNGYQATKRIRKLEDPIKANIPIIALTALAQTDVKEKTELYKMNGFMGKPFEPNKLYALLEVYSRSS
ncbi:PAS domain-containing hybrid sensor histidine kinase/response regulator [Algibacter sp. L4_22]|uniref:PAS domain-containing hybrid sensor histidine kinase/response regulator n=1 Tax=Algibacter sp. L4_22 TaxID=2942477 RepID=UPI00201B7C7E|nr:ATP-binding protein [Algibacter sp. L4_22]MCL5129088.1 ATP-binding protein [Algibacter sp. L4_22]